MSLIRSAIWKPCPDKANCRIQLAPDTEPNKFDLSGNTIYYLAEGTLVIKDADSGQYLYDMTADPIGPTGEVSPLTTIQDIPNNLSLSPIDDFLLMGVRITDFNSNIRVFYSNNISIAVDTNKQVATLLEIRGNTYINGRLHTLDYDGQVRPVLIKHTPPAPTLEITSDAKFNLIISES